MKKITSLFIVFLSVILIAACAKVRNQVPVITAESTTFSIYQGDLFNPLAGITATDVEDDKDNPNFSTSQITHNLPTEYINSAGRWIGPVGTFSYIASIEDSAGAVADIPISIQVSANELELNGPDNIEYYIGYDLNYTALYTAQDNVTGNLTSTISFDVTQVNFNVARPEAYTMIVSVKDAIDKIITRNINLSVLTDTVRPTISLPSSTILYVMGETQPDLMDQVTANDNVEGNITSKIVLDDEDLDYTTEGAYTVSYTVEDKVGNKTTRVRLILVVEELPEGDTVPPTINAPDRIFYIGHPTTEIDDLAYWLENVTITDNIDDEVLVIVDYSQVDFTTVGVYDVIYTAIDQSGNPAQEIIELRVMIDNIVPTIEGAKDHRVDIGGYLPDLLDGVTANDNADGNISNRVTVDSSQVDVDVAGSYPITFRVVDIAGNVTTVNRIVNVTQPGPVLIGVNARQSYYLGSKTYAPLRGITATDGAGNDITDQIEVVGSYQTIRPGRSSFAISVTNNAGITTSIAVSLVVKAKVDIAETLTTAPIEIELWHGNGSTIEAALVNYANQFKLLYPNITVKITKIGNNYDEVRQATINAIRGGKLPNLVQSYPDHVMEYLDNNALVSVTPYYDHPTHGYDDTGSGSFADIVASYRQENNQYTAEGDFFALPFNKSTEVVIYNKTYYDRLVAKGLAPAEFPETWQDLFALDSAFRSEAFAYMDEMQAFHAQSIQQTIHINNAQLEEFKNRLVPVSYDSQDNAFITLLRQWGGRYTTIDTDRKGVILFDNPQAREMLNFIYDNKNIMTVPSNWDADYASDIFKKGMSFVTIGSTGGVRYNVPDKIIGAGGVDLGYPFEFEVVPMLYNKNRPDLHTAIQQGTNISLTATGTQQEKLASWLFLKFLTSYEVQKDFAMITGYHPVRTSVYSDVDYVRFLNGLNELGEPLFGEELMKSKASNAAALQAHKTFFDQAYVGSSAARDAVGIAFEQVMLATSRAIIETSLAQAVADAKRVLGN